MFNAKKPSAAPAVHTLLGKDTLWKGEVHCGPTSLRIEGRVEGTIHGSGEVTIAPSGFVEGTIQAKHLIVTGKVKGVVKVTECLEIHGTGLVEGEAEVGSLVVDEGGRLQGTCTHRERGTPAKPEPRSEAKGPVTKSPNGEAMAGAK